jgi:hypothetical protein
MALGRLSRLDLWFRSIWTWVSRRRLFISLSFFLLRLLPAQAIGPPYFYCENVALAPKGVWTTISRFLYDIQPEFVNLKYFCAARKRGYILICHLRIGQLSLLPIPPKTIFEAFLCYVTRGNGRHGT